MNNSPLPSVCAAWVERWVGAEALATVVRRARVAPGDAELMAWLFSILDCAVRDFAALVLDTSGAPAQASLHRALTPIRDAPTARQALPLLSASMSVARVHGAQPLFLGSLRLAVDLSASLDEERRATGALDRSGFESLFGKSATLDMALYRGVASGVRQDAVSRLFAPRVVAWPAAESP
jgi:hypothetical protein